MFQKQTYIGRFAPSPTGPLHFGSVYTALASFLQARSQQGQWLLRIDDLDTPRNIKGSVESILSTLDTLGLYWDGKVAYQSQTLDVYHQVLEQLALHQLIYPCICSRKTLTQRYNGRCRYQTIDLVLPHAWRIKTDQQRLSFKDVLQGSVSECLSEQGDFILKRKDQIMAYQFAVVVDDHLQGINQVVRGYDLLDSTPRQIFLHHVLGYTLPSYMHVPIIIDEQGYKLSKQTLATAVDLTQPESLIFKLLMLLKQNPPNALKEASVDELLAWGMTHWNPAHLQGCSQLTIPSA